MAKAKRGQQFRDRIKSLRRVRAGDLLANRNNWRTHPEKQRAAMRGVLSEIGFAGAVIARETKSGEIEIIDGHLRADIDPEQLVPVLITDLSEHEAQKLLLVYDPIGDLAGTDAANLRLVFDAVQFKSEDLAALVTELAEEAGLIDLTEDAADDGPTVADEVLQIVVDCKSRAEQKQLLAELNRNGYTCRAKTA